MPLNLGMVYQVGAIFNYWKLANSWWFESKYFRVLSVFSGLILAISAYLLSTIPNYLSSLNIKEIFGFIGICWNFLYLLGNFLLNIIGNYCQDVMSSSNARS